jgi:hypothetical protein
LSGTATSEDVGHVATAMRTIELALAARLEHLQTDVQGLKRERHEGIFDWLRGRSTRDSE